MTGPNATHQIACHNPPTPNEVRGGRPLRPGVHRGTAAGRACSTS